MYRFLLNLFESVVILCCCMGGLYKQSGIESCGCPGQSCGMMLLLMTPLLPGSFPNWESLPCFSLIYPAAQHSAEQR